MSSWVLVLGCVWHLASELLIGPPLDSLFTVSTCSVVAVKEFILFTLPLLWVGSDIFRSASIISLGVNVGLVVLCCEAVLSTSGIGLKLFSSKPGLLILPNFVSLSWNRILGKHPDAQTGFLHTCL